ncbi:MAG: DUF3810 domain-containing protein [Acidobacteriota bacterium]|nr:DUF3810 domain-containing protein [Acidobacteriota bacterium]
MRIRWWVVLTAVAAGLVPLDPRRVERWYSAGVYPQLQHAITPLTNRTSVALLDLSVALCVIGAAWALSRRVLRLGVRRAFLRSAGSLVTVGAVGYLLFLVLWGLNYRRAPLERKLDWDASRITRGAAVSLANTAARSVNGGFAAAHAGEWDVRALERSFAETQHALGAERGAVPGVPKRSLLTLYFRRAAIDGMTNPFFLEIIVNPELLGVERPYVIAHEWAHLAGYADESEANFVAWLTCVRGDPLARYSGWLAAYEQATRALPRDAREELTPLAAGPREDLRAIANRYERSSPTVRKAAQGVYDGYLRANRVEEGIGSYDAVVRLMLGTRFGPHWTPQARDPGEWPAPAAPTGRAPAPRAPAPR